MKVIQIIALNLFWSQALIALDVPQFYRKLNRASQAGDVAAYIELMQELEVYEGLGFGAGLGPENQQSFRLRLVVSAWPHLISAQEDLRAVDVRHLDTWTRKVVMAARHKTDDQQMIVDLLQDQEPSLRWVGLQLLPGSWDEMPENVREIVTIIATSDPYIIISIQYRQPPPGGRPLPPGSHDNVMVAPLRESAQRISGQPAAAAGRDQLEAEGALRLIDIAEQSSEQIPRVLGAFRMLKPEGDVVLAIQEMIAKEASLDEVKTMVRNRLEVMQSSDAK